MENLEEGTAWQPMTMAGTSDQKEFLRLRTLIVLTGFMPRFVLRFFLKGKRYRWLPACRTTHGLNMLSGLLKRCFTKRRQMPAVYRLSEFALYHVRFAFIKMWFLLRRRLSRNKGAVSFRT